MANRIHVALITLVSAVSIAVGAAPTTNARPAVPLPADVQPTDQQFTDVIKTRIGSGPSFTIVNVVTPQPDWYVVTIRADSGQNSLVIAQQATGPLTVVAGPGGYFPTLSAPDAVRQYLASKHAI